MLPPFPLKPNRDESRPRGATVQPVKWRAVALNKKDSIGSAFSSAGGGLLAQLQANQPGTLAGEDPEYLHQLRISVRRLRATLSLYSGLLNHREKRTVIQNLKWVARALGQARDSDVFVSEIWPPLRAVLGEGPLTKTLNRTWLAQRLRHAQTAQRTLSSPRFQRLLIKLEHWFSAPPWRNSARAEQLAAQDQPARSFAKRELKHRAKPLLRAGRRLDQLDPHRRHRLRIRIKKFRYGLEAVSPLFNRKPVKRILKALARSQEILGAMNDLAVAEHKIDQALPDGASLDLAQLRRRLKLWRNLHSIALKHQLRTAWRDCRHAITLWEN